MKRGIIIINAYSNLTSSLNQSKRLKEEFKKRGVEVEIVRNDKFLAYVGEGGIVSEKPDFCIYLDKDKYISEMLEKEGVRLFNRHDAVRVCDDKMRTYIELSESGIPVPKTFAGFLCYDPQMSVKDSEIERLESELGYPMVVKECYGSLGKGVYKVDNAKELKQILEKLKCIPHLIQQFISTSAGKDTRVIVIGGKILCAMRRESSCDFRSNIELGGVGSAVELNEDQIILCEKVAKNLGLDYCGIDLLDGESGKSLVCEVNSNAFFGGIEAVTGVNVAEKYCDYILSEIEKSI